MTNRTPWQDAENIGLVSMYFDMLDTATSTCGAQYKAAMIRTARGTPKPNDADAAGIDRVYAGTLANRSRGSIEFKLMNASAAHADLLKLNKLDGETMHEHGYRALPNYQASLKLAMRDALSNRPQYDGRAEQFARELLA